MTMRPGDMQFVNNYHVLHARDGYADDRAAGQDPPPEAAVARDRRAHRRRQARAVPARPHRQLLVEQGPDQERDPRLSAQGSRARSGAPSAAGTRRSAIARPCGRSTVAVEQVHCNELGQHGPAPRPQVPCNSTTTNGRSALGRRRRASVPSDVPPASPACDARRARRANGQNPATRPISGSSRGRCRNSSATVTSCGPHGRSGVAIMSDG